MPDGKASLTPRQVKEQWEEIKAKERKDAGANDKTVLSGVPRSMPSLLRAYELSTRAAMVGFDWVTTDDVIDKAEEEIRELREAVADGGGTSREAEEEFGDLLFALVNVARKLGIEPEAALRVANDKFQRRFDDLERQVTARRPQASRSDARAARRALASRQARRQPRKPRLAEDVTHEGTHEGNCLVNHRACHRDSRRNFFNGSEAIFRQYAPPISDVSLVCRHRGACTISIGLASGRRRRRGRRCLSRSRVVCDRPGGWSRSSVAFAFADGGEGLLFIAKLLRWSP